MGDPNALVLMVSAAAFDILVIGVSVKWVRAAWRKDGEKGDRIIESIPQIVRYPLERVSLATVVGVVSFGCLFLASALELFLESVGHSGSEVGHLIVIVLEVIGILGVLPSGVLIYTLQVWGRPRRLLPPGQR